ncbi:Lipoprotein signal peptidase [Aquisphaera giovannonii]|uniref:Lipoprotein signal peptidase n=1 Tax=Aquisphaera giovannonii TaxID=406548 RepID=A0A5B9VYY5_9BACT|nr:signal peptidase II [Aquisphaera giovannonii]QEH33217.1 Lipoprotein signal peptidase [Aquisphaera giovannonii]
MTRRIGLGRWLLFWSIALGGAAFDLVTKSLIFARFGEPGEPGSRIFGVVPGILDIQTSLNKGALWGFGGSYAYSSQLFAGLSIVAGVAIVYYLFVRGAAESLALTVALALIMAGAMGNCYDRLVVGRVRDFVHFHVDSIGFDWAIFNFADNMLVIGSVILILFALRPEASRAADPQATARGPLVGEPAEGAHPA